MEKDPFDAVREHGLIVQGAIYDYLIDIVEEIQENAIRSLNLNDITPLKCSLKALSLMADRSSPKLTPTIPITDLMPKKAISECFHGLEIKSNLGLQVVSRDSLCDDTNAKLFQVLRKGTANILREFEGYQKVCALSKSNEFISEAIGVDQYFGSHSLGSEMVNAFHLLRVTMEDSKLVNEIALELSYPERFRLAWMICRAKRLVEELYTSMATVLKELLPWMVKLMEAEHGGYTYDRIDSLILKFDNLRDGLHIDIKNQITTLPYLKAIEGR